MQKRRFHRTTIIAVGLAAFLIGLALGRTKTTISGYLVLLSLALVIGATKRLRSQTIVFLAIFALLFGWWRGGLFMQQLAKYNNLYDNRIVVYGTANTDAIYAANSPQLSFDLGNLQLNKPQNTKLIGKLAIKGFGPTAIYKGDQLRVEGKLRRTLGSKQGSMFYGKIELLGRAKSPIDNARRRFAAGMQSALPEPLASFGMGLLIGQRNTLPKQTTDMLAAVGLTHIIAVSGYNLTIIIRGVRRLLKKRSKYQSTILAAALIGSFLLFTGFSPSITRRSEER